MAEMTIQSQDTAEDCTIGSEQLGGPQQTPEQCRGLLPNV